MSLALNEALIEQAREMHGDDDLVIDADAAITQTDAGAWVQAWVFVPGADEPLPRHFDDTPEPPYIPEPTPEESDHYARMWWGGRLG